MHDANVRSTGKRGLKRAANPSRRRLRCDPRAFLAPRACVRRMALIDPNDLRAVIPKSSPPRPYVLAFSKGQFYVPASAVISYPKRPNVVSDGTKLGEILFTKAPSAWMDYCDPETLIHIKGNDDSTCVYTTFAVEGHEDEQRFLRLISGSIAAKNFPEWKEKIQKKIADPKDKMQAPTNERQEKRLEVLDWKKEESCPTKAQLNPEINGWTPLGKEGGEPLLKSCRIDPESKKRNKGSDGKATGSSKSVLGKRLRQVQFETVVEDLGPKGSYAIIEQPGFVHIIQYAQEDSKETEDAHGISVLDEDL